MNKIEELIKKLCPNGVKYQPLVNLCGTITTGKLNANAMVENGEYPFFTCDASPFKIDKYAFDEEAILISGNGSQVGHINYYKGKFNAYQRTYVLYNFKQIEVKFLLHYLGGYLRDYIMIHSKKGSVPYITLPMLQNFSVPVPPLEVQDEIVHLLDDFMLLSAELSAELKARQKQYEYYKDKLFDFDKNMEVPLSEICSMERGGNFQKKHFTEEGVPAIHYGKIYTYYGLYTDKTLNFIDEKIAEKQKFAKNNDIVMAITSENVEDVCKCVVWEGKEPVAVSGHSVIIRHNQNARFLAYYFTSSHFQRQKERYCIGTKVIEMKPDNLAKILVPIPSIEEQNRIVSILDKFYSITNDISEGLPAEIELRQKQYEYYRDKLLTFKEISNG